MGKIHQTLAVESDIKGKSTAIYTETKSVFNNKKDHFLGIVKAYTPLREDLGDSLPGERKEMVTTVADKLQWTEKAMVELLDLVLQKEEANQRARADVVINGQVVLKDVPALALINIEAKLEQMIQLYREIPTLEPGRRWTPDVNQKNVYVGDAKVTFRTQKEVEYKVVAPATDKHPAQVANWTKDVNVGRWETLDYSGMMSPVAKAELLERAEKLLIAVKTARCAANETEVKGDLAGMTAKLFDFVHGGI
jgi:hypothetical protein